MHAAHTRCQLHSIMQEYWPAVVKFAQQHQASGLDEGEELEEEDAGVKEAVQATQAGVKPPSAAGPFVSDSSQVAATGAAKKEL